MSITILAFAAVSTSYKVSQVRKCESWVFLGGLYTLGALSAGITFASQVHNLHFPVSIWVMGLGSGALGLSSLLCFLRALKMGGSLSLANIIVQMSLCVPIIYAVCFLGEKLTVMRVVGLALFVVFLVLLNEPAKPSKEES